MAWRHFGVVLMTSLLVLQWTVHQRPVTARCVDEGTAALRCLLPLLSSSTAVKRSPIDAHIQRLWLSRGSISPLMTDQMRQLLDSSADMTGLLSQDSDGPVDGSRSMRYGR